MRFVVGSAALLPASTRPKSEGLHEGAADLVANCALMNQGALRLGRATAVVVLPSRRVDLHEGGDGSQAVTGPIRAFTAQAGHDAESSGRYIVCPKRGSRHFRCATSDEIAVANANRYVCACDSFTHF